jgi:Cyclin M transmembrane N-terminal domain
MSRGVGGVAAAGLESGLRARTGREGCDGMEMTRELFDGLGRALGASSLYTWGGIAICISQSAIFSGLNLAVFSVSRLRLEVETAGGNRDASKVLDLRRESNFTLATILWGNVAVNVLLTLLSDSVLAGVGAFVFSTVVITFFGEIIPQAYFSRNALRMAAVLTPVLRIYRMLLFPVAKTTAIFLDWWLGPESIVLFRERDFRALITRHVDAAGGDVGRVEAAGALNFLDLDDIMALDEGEPVDPRSIISLPVANGRPVLPPFQRSPHDPFLRRLDASGKKWVIFTDPSGQPRLVLDAHHFLRDTLFDTVSAGPEAYWHRPITVSDPREPLGDVISRMKVKPEHPEDDVIDHDLILVWGAQKRIITGADLLGRLLRGIARREAPVGGACSAAGS